MRLSNSVLPALLILFLTLSATAAEAPNPILDLATATPAQIVPEGNLKKEGKMLRKIERVVHINTEILFVTQCRYQAGDKSVAIDGWANLLGVDNATFQEITNEFNTYLDQRLAESFILVPFSELQAHEKFPDINVRVKPEELGVDDKHPMLSYGVTRFRRFSANNSPLYGGGFMKSTMATAKALIALKAAQANWTMQLDFAFPTQNSGLSYTNQGKVASVGMEPTMFANAFGIGGGLVIGDLSNIVMYGYNAAGYRENDWVKSVKKVDGAAVWDITADPVKYKAAALKTLKANADVMFDRIKAAKTE